MLTQRTVYQDKLGKLERPVSIEIGLGNHLVELSVRHGHLERLEHEEELGGRHMAVPVQVELVKVVCENLVVALERHVRKSNVTRKKTLRPYLQLLGRETARVAQLKHAAKLARLSSQTHPGPARVWVHRLEAVNHDRHAVRGVLCRRSRRGMLGPWCKHR